MVDGIVSKVPKETEEQEAMYYFGLKYLLRTVDGADDHD